MGDLEVGLGITVSVFSGCDCSHVQWSVISLESSLLLQLILAVIMKDWHPYPILQTDPFVASAARSTWKSSMIQKVSVLFRCDTKLGSTMIWPVKTQCGSVFFFSRGYFNRLG